MWIAIHSMRSPVPGHVRGRGQLWRTPPGRSLRRRRVSAGTGSGVHEAMDRAKVRAFSLSMMPGNRRRSSMAVESSPCSLKMARIAAAASLETTNTKGAWAATQAAGKPIYLSGRSNSAQLGFNCATTANFAFRLWPAGNRFGSAATFASDDPVF
jgi:hypothetical protein